MKPETIESIKSAIKATISEIKEKGYDQRFKEMLHSVRYSFSSELDINDKEMIISDTRYALCGDNITGRFIRIYENINSIVPMLATTITYDGEDFKLESHVEKSTTRYIDLLSDDNGQLNILMDHL